VNNNFVTSSLQQKLADKLNKKLHSKDFDRYASQVYNDSKNSSYFLPPRSEFLRESLLKNANQFKFKVLNQTENLVGSFKKQENEKGRNIVLS